MSKILIEIWQSSSRMYSCLVLYCSNQHLLASSVLDLDLLQWISPVEVNYPSLFKEMAHANGTYNTKDLTMLFMRMGERNVGHCLQDLVTIGFIDTNTIGCVASEVVLYLSLVFIIGVVAIRFVMAVMFQWFFSWKLGNFPRETYEQRMQRSAEIENWSSNIYRPAPSQYRPNVGKDGLRKKENRKTFFLGSHPQRLSLKDQMDDQQQHMACSIPRLMPIGSAQPCMRLL